MINSINRRRFMQSAGLGAATFALSHRLVLGNPYNVPIGLQMYTVEDHLKKDLTGTIAKIAGIGYREVEVGGFHYYGQKPDELRRKLADHGLKAISTHFTEEQLTSNLEMNIAGAKECGVTYIGLASLDEKDRKSLDAIKRAAEWFNKLGEAIDRAGCHFFYHGHNFDFANVEGGGVIYDELLRRTDPKTVNFELDCFWCVRAGKDPVDYFNRFPGRFPQLHIKDLKPGYSPTTTEDFRKGPFTEVGQGVIDWKKIFRAAPRGGMKHFYVEQDECDRDSLESAKISYTYLHNLTV
jgi:sugar phosphate isomerase/epimerase